MRLGNVCNLLATGFFAALLVISALIAQKEIAIATGAAGWDASYILGQNGALPMGYSLAADYAVSDACLRAATSPEGLFLPSTARKALLVDCQSLAQRITDSSPLNSYGWLLRAQFAAALGQDSKIESALRHSYATGPTEQWLAELRVPVAEAALAGLSPVARAGHRQDLALLVQSRRGIAAIARRYVQDEGFRARITAVVEALPAAAQARFVQVLRATVRQR